MRLIDADALKEEVNNKKVVGIFNTLNLIDNAPTVEYTFEEAFQKTVCEKKLYCPNKRQKGEWEYVQYDANPNIGNWHCSECRHIVAGKYDQKPDYNFCPNCGADMRGEQEAKQYALGYQDGFLDAKKQFERPQGEWHHSGECSVCHKRSYKTTPSGEIIGLDFTDFCKNCGAQMRGKQE